MTTPQRPRRPDGARICASCLQEFPQGRGYAEHQCPGRPAPELAKRLEWAENQATTVSPAGVPTTIDALLQIIDVLWAELPADVAIRLAGEQPEIADACRNIHELVNHTPAPRKWNPMKQDFE